MCEFGLLLHLVVNMSRKLKMSRLLYNSDLPY
jgi:hypothetical protein